MARLPAFADHRFIGVRASMTVYDCDDAEQFEMLAAEVDGDDLVAANGLASFAPDSVAEARNRGFNAP
jgi:hypothetical protein